MRWHCYTLAWDAVQSATVEAPDAGTAATLAAAQTGADGLWTVIAVTEERGVVEVKVQGSVHYEALSVDVV